MSKLLPELLFFISDKFIWYLNLTLMGILFQTGRRQIILLMILLGFLSLAVFWTVTYQMYVKQTNQEIIFLKYLANTTKSLIESIINEEMGLHKKIIPENIYHQIRYHMKLGQNEISGLGETGEIIIGVRHENFAKYILDLRFSRETKELWISMDHPTIAEPMRKAVSGNSGSLTGLDYRGVKVLAAIESIPAQNIGIVAKIDISEIQKPYLSALAYSLVLVIFLFGGSGFIIIRIGEKVILINETREQKYRAYIAYAPVGMIVCDQNGNFLEINDKASEIMGYPREELSGKNFGDLIPNKVIKVHLKNSLINEMAQFFNAEHQYINRNGEKYFLMISVVRFSHERYLGFITDITQVKEMENRLKESEARLNIALETTRIGIWDWNIQKDEMFATPTYFTMLGYLPEKVALDRKIWIGRSHPNDQELINEKIKNVLFGAELIHQYEARMLHSDGNYRWVSVLGKVVETNVDGEPLRMLGTQIDVTERKEAEQALRKSNELLQSVIENAPVRIFWKDLDSRYLGCNNGFAKDAGLTSPEELIGKNDFDLGWRDQAELYRADDQAIMRSGIPKLAFEEPQTTPDGKTLWLNTSKVPLRNEKNEVFGILGLYTDITLRKVAEEKLKLFRALLDNSSDAIEVLDPSTLRIIDTNETQCRDLGYNRKELLSMNIFDIDPSFNADSQKYIARQLDEYGSVQFESLHKRKDGSTFPVEISSKFIILDKPYVLNIVRNITQRKKAELEIYESEKRFRSLFENMLEGYAYCKVDYENGIPIDFKILNVNKAFGDLTHLKDVVGKYVSNVIPGVHKANPELLEIYGRVSLTGEPERFITYLEALDSWFSITVYSYEKEYFVAIFDNITSQKRLEKELGDSEKKYRTLFDNSKDAIMLLDEFGFFDCNARTLEVFGCEKKEEFIGKHPAQFSPATQADGEDSMFLAQDYIAKAFKDGFAEFEWIHKKKDESIFPAEVLLTSLDLNGKQVIQATVRDITQRKFIENQLLQSAKMATLGEMATGIAHEINQPLTVIKMGAQMISRNFKNKQLTDEFLLDQTSKFLRNIERATRIIDHLRIFGRKISENLAPVNINNPVNNALEMVSSKLHHASINLNLDTAKSIPDVLGEENSLEQVFINILLNAVDALSDHEMENREITVKTTYSKDENLVSVLIGNNGPSIPEPILQKIFEPFFTTKPAGQGTGLGLSISYGIIQSMGGKIFAQNSDMGPMFVTKLKVYEKSMSTSV